MVPNLHTRWPAPRPMTLLVLALLTAVAALPVTSTAGPLADPMKKQPYLVYPGDPAHMQVLWQLSATATSTFEWGTDLTYSGGSVANDEYGADHQHTVTLAGLVPGVHYLYRVTTGGVAYAGSFTAAPDTGAQQVKFFAYGDTRTDPASDDLVTAAMASVYAADPAFQTMTLFMGDFVYYGNDETYWTNEFFSPTYTHIRALGANLPFQATMGNHDSSSPVLFTKYFPYPWAGGRYWSFDYGPVHVAVLDQYTAYTAGSAQLVWLAADLAASHKTWKMVLLHEPGWSAGGGHANNTAVQSLVEPLCEQNGVSMVFAGHNHYYARAMVNGIAHVTTGGGGAPLNTPVLPAADVVTATSAFHYCTIAIDGGVLRFRAVTPTGALLDSFTLQRAIVDVTPPVVQLLAPVGGERWFEGETRSVRWSASDNVGVDSLNIDWSSHGVAGPWALVAHGLANSGSYDWTLPAQPTDSALVRVTAYDHARNARTVSSDSLFHVVDPSAGVGPSVDAGLRLSRPRPNPSRGEVLLTFALPRAGRARLDIVDLGGRRVWVSDAERGAGTHTVRWDGRGTAGRTAAPGLYFVRLVTPFGARVERLARVW